VRWWPNRGTTGTVPTRRRRVCQRWPRASAIAQAGAPSPPAQEQRNVSLGVFQIRDCSNLDKSNRGHAPTSPCPRVRRHHQPWGCGGLRRNAISGWARIIAELFTMTSTFHTRG
jgi:hypothetical protein